LWRLYNPIVQGIDKACRRSGFLEQGIDNQKLLPIPQTSFVSSKKAGYSGILF
jgi:hypothetical protein